MLKISGWRLWLLVNIALPMSPTVREGIVYAHEK
jgi:hypothetical protein